jgi:L-alanine-DL-glutamate epimerase-like enolase superfamily enzyme
MPVSCPPKPAAVKIRFDNDCTRPDGDIPGDIAKARAARRLFGNGFPLAFDANNGYSVGGAVCVGRVLEELGYWWFEEPVQHYHVKAMGEVSRRLDITVSAGEQTYTLSGLTDLVSVCKSTRANWPSAAPRSRNDYAPDNRGDKRDGSFKVRLGNR